MTWTVLDTTSLFSAGFFNLRSDRCRLPDGRVMPRYYVMEFLDWVNVVAVAKTGELILVEQYRHAARETFLEIPGGGTDPGEAPAAAAARELREETGYLAGEWIDCGYHFPNPALQSNRMHTFLALDCTRVGDPEPDPFEDLRPVTMPVAELFDRWLAGDVKHALISASLALAYRHLRARGVLY